MQPLSLREKAINYRKQGYSYNMITEKLGVAKSTLSNWLRYIPYSPNQEVINRVGSGKLKSAMFKHNQKMKDIENMRILAKQDIKMLTERDWWLLGIGLYLGEGTKSYENVRIINADPDIMRIAIKWFRNVCSANDENFFPTVHLYPDNDIRECIKYWSEVINVPEEQFGKTQTDRRNNKSGRKKRKLPYGTLHLQVRSCGKKELGVRLHRRIMGWIEAISSQL